MSINPSIDNFLLFLEKKEYNEFLSSDFIAFRCSDKNQYTTKEPVYGYFVDKEISMVSVQKEDSHYLLFYKVNDIKYIMKAKLDGDGYIQSLIEEEYNELNKQVVLVIEYDGKNYYGMQKQNNPSFNSIQSEIESAIKRMISKDIDIIVSSRTDKGVHAKGQVVQFPSNGIDHKKYKYALNNLLPKDIRIIDSYSRSQLFNCRYDTIKKEYEYIIDTGEYSVFEKDYVYYTKINDLSRIRKELKSLLGTHDFVAFSKGEKDNTVRTIYEASVKKKGTRLYFKFVGSGFLHNMIRFIIGSLIEIDKNKKSNIKDLIDSRNKNETAFLAPASGLYLIKIDY